MQSIVNAIVREGENSYKVLWEKRKYLQAQLLTLTLGLNKMNEWYTLNRRGYRTWLLKIIFFLYHLRL